MEKRARRIWRRQRGKKLEGRKRRNIGEEGEEEVGIGREEELGDQKIGRKERRKRR